MPTIDEIFLQAVREHQGGNLEQAEALYLRVLEADRGHADAYHFLGLLARQVGNLPVAETLLRQTLALKPTAEAYANLGLVYKELGQNAQAIPYFREALDLNPYLEVALLNLAILLSMAKQLDEAEILFRQILQNQPDQPSAYYNLGNIFLEKKNLKEASAYFREALRLNPHYANAYCNLGNCYRDQGKLSEATLCYRDALHIDPNDVEARDNLATALKDQGLLTEAEAEYKHALQINPHHGNGLLNRALLWLLQGQFAKGWPGYEFRWQAIGATPRFPNWPRWDGSFLTGKTILLYAEQGLGDTINFIRYAALVKQRGARVIFECQPALIPLLENGAGVDMLVPSGQPLPTFDVQAPLLSLPGIFGTTPDTIPADVPYLHAKPEKIETWQHTFSGEPESPAGVASGSPLNIGIVWQGNPLFPGDRFRSIPLRYYEVFAGIKGVRLFSLQKEPTGLAQLRARVDHVPIVDLSDKLETFDDTAAAMKNLDLVISSCTSVPHLAGALGVPVWLATSLVPDWRWLMDREDSPWYPSMRLFRQKRLGDWTEVFDRMAEELRGMVASRSGSANRG